MKNWGCTFVWNCIRSERRLTWHGCSAPHCPLPPPPVLWNTLSVGCSRRRWLSAPRSWSTSSCPRGGSRRHQRGRSPVRTLQHRTGRRRARHQRNRAYGPNIRSPKSISLAELPVMSQPSSRAFSLILQVMKVTV